MAVSSEIGGRRINPWRAIGWGTVAFLLLLPLVAMQFTDEVRWTLSDFVFAALLMGIVGLAFELTVRVSDDWAWRAGVGAALAGAFFLVWVNGAVGLVGNENDDFNLLYFAVLAVALLGSIAARFRPAGMSLAMAATALVFPALAAAALALGKQHGPESSVVEILAVNAVFAVPWLVSALLFRTASTRSPRGRGAVG